MKHPLVLKLYVMLVCVGCSSSSLKVTDAQQDVPASLSDVAAEEIGRWDMGDNSSDGGRLATGGNGGTVPSRGTGGVSTVREGTGGAKGAGGDTISAMGMGGSSGGAAGAGGQTGGHPGTGGDGDAGIDASYGACTDDSDCTLVPGAGCCGGCFAAGDPRPPSLPCSSTCEGGFRAYTCACVDNRCSQGDMPAGSPCDPNRDLCVHGTKCCVACAATSVDGAVACASPVCTEVKPFTMAPECPVALPPQSVDGG